MQASLPRFFSGFFFGVLRTLAELRSADCRFGTECVWLSSFFFCGKNERESSPLRRRDSEARSFRRSETAPPQAQPPKLTAGPDGYAVRRAQSAQKKRVKITGSSLLESLRFTLFFV